MLFVCRHYFLPLCSVVILSAGLLSGCSALKPQEQAEEVVLDEENNLYYPLPAQPGTTSKPVYQPIPAATLYSLLVAEFAGQRQRYDISLYHYMDQARSTRDPAIAERAARIAQFVGSPPHALEALDIWLLEEPENPTAHQAAAQLLMENGQHEQALQHLQQLQRLSGISQYDYLAANAGHLAPEQQLAVLDLLQQLRNKQPDNAAIWYAIAIMHQHLQQYDEALKSIDQSLRINPKYLSAGLQKARIMVLLKRHDEALRWLKQLRRDHPQHKGMQVLQARVFLEMQRMPEALTAFRDLHLNFPEDPAILLSLALLEEEAGHYEQASAYFYQLLARQNHINESHFYLGRIADNEERYTDAINHFSQVTGGREFLPAHLRAAQLMQQENGLLSAREYLQEQRDLHPHSATDLLRIEIEMLSQERDYHTALQLVNEALQQQPDQADLLYTRAMLAERTDNLEQMERDLRSLIEQNPDNADALNALGYALADRTERWNEALPLIQRAIALEPENPAIIDSLGWVYFRMGKIEQALPLLEQAFSLMPDHEIAAHLGEVLWLTGERQRAIEVWQQGYDNTPDSPVIDTTLERLQVEPGLFNNQHP